MHPSDDEASSPPTRSTAPSGDAAPHRRGRWREDAAELHLSPNMRIHPVLERESREAGAFEEQRPLDKVVFGIAAVVAVGFVLWGTLSTATLASASEAGLGWVVHNTGWLFSLAASVFVGFVVWLAASSYGRIRLGRPNEAPEFRTTSWVAMMFSAGMGIGLMFYGVSEPLTHFVTPPPGTGGPGNPDAVKTAMATTMFHWTFHPWAIYAVVGLAVAYGVFRKDRSLLMSSAFAPLFGRRVSESPMGRLIDIFAIFATLFGSATSLGLGALQIGSGLKILGWAGEVTNTLLIIIITVLTICFILSAVSGVARGIQWLSNINMVLAILLALFVFVAGPTVFILDLLPTTIGAYFQDFSAMAARTDAAGGDEMATWLSSWTIFYWAWWVSWTPFVGMFIGRISRGRTIREFVTGVLLVPSAVSLVWFAIFGGAGIRAQQSGLDIAGLATPEGQLFTLLGSMPLAQVTTIIVVVLVAIFFISGADASSIVMGTLSERGSIEPKRWTVVFWGVATGAVAAIMLAIGGEDALSGLQTVTIIAALPFLVIMVLLCVALLKDLGKDPLIMRQIYGRKAVEDAVVAGATAHGDNFGLVIEPTAPGSGVGDRAAAGPADRAGAAAGAESADGQGATRADG